MNSPATTMRPHRLRAEDEIQRLRDRAADPEFADAWGQVMANAEEALRLNLQPSDRPGGWWHHYFCKEHSVLLEFRPDHPHEHLCPVDQAVITGDDADGAWLVILSERILDGAQACALVWLATGREEMLGYARDVLLRWAELYPDLEPHGTLQNTGKVHGISLGEAAWGLHIAEIYDDIIDGLTDEQESSLRSFLRQVAGFVSSQRLHKLHNIECWHVAAVAILGAVLDEESLIDEGVEGPHGLRAQLESGIRADGWWTEGATTYQFYMLRAVLPAVSTLRRSRPELADSARLRSMVIAPLTMLRRDISLPTMNDGADWFSEPNGIARARDLYELAYGLWGQPEVAALIGLLQERGYPRESANALTHGPSSADLGGAALPEPVWLFPASGWAVLGDPARDTADRRVLVKYGPHGGGHGHPDKLELDYHGFGRPLAPDLGGPGYNSPLQGGWIRQSVSHNTAWVQGTPQPPGRGALVTHERRDDGYGIVDAVIDWSADDGQHGAWLAEPRDADAEAAYQGVRMRRLLLTSPDGYLVDVMTVHQDTPGLIEQSWRHRGHVTDDLAADDAWQPVGEGEEHLTMPRQAPAGGLTWAIAGIRTRLWADLPADAAADASTSAKASATVLRCPQIGLEPAPDLLLRRTTGTTATFVAVVESTDADFTITDVAVTPTTDALQVDVATATGRTTWLVQPGDDPTTTVTSDGGDPQHITVRVADHDVALVPSAERSQA